MLPKYFFFISIISTFIFTHSYSQCLDHQKVLLLQLKNALIFNHSVSTRLVQWNQTDECCNWYGVDCNAAGNVVGLQLNDEDLSAGIGDSWSLFAKFSNLASLSLVNCRLNGTLPDIIFQIPTLLNLDLSSNELLSGSIPPFTQTGSLESITLSSTNLSGLIPSSISKLNSLFQMDLSFSKFTGWIPSTFANLTQLTHVDLSENFLTGSVSSAMFGGLSNLVFLNLEFNSFSGNIPQSLFGLPSLSRLYLSYNKFTGLVEEFDTVNISNIFSLDLSSNRLEGPIPDSFFKLEHLQYLWLSDNLFNGSFRLDKIQRLPDLTALDLSNNLLSVDTSNVNSSSCGFPKLIKLGLASCHLHEFPDFIKHCDVIVLDLSNNRIAGVIPSWIWGRQLQNLNLSLNLLTDLQKPYHISPYLQVLDLHSNQLSSELHQLVPPIIGNSTSYLVFLLLANNSFSGSIPTSLCSSPYLEVLDLSINKLSGNIPPCLAKNTLVITVFDLRQNNISGLIPDNFSLLCKLQYFDLSNNTLEGKIPKSLESCKALEFMNVGNNFINDSFPCMVASSLRVLVLHSNRFHGEVRCRESWPKLQILDISSNDFSGSLESINFSNWKAMVQRNDSQLRHKVLGLNYYTVGIRITMKGLEVQLVKIWPDFTAIDFSCNNFRGEIPNAIGDLSLLHLLNLSQNALNDSIPKLLGKLGELESLDLSENQLTGAIPVELAELKFLSVLNLAYNKLVGKIPSGGQLQTFPADYFRGNPGLCGFNINISCSDTDDDDLSPPGHENVEEKREIEWEYVTAALGYVVGLGSFVWLLLFCRVFRKKYFDKIDEVVGEIFDGRDRRRRRARRVARNQVRRQ